MQYIPSVTIKIDDVEKKYYLKPETSISFRETLPFCIYLEVGNITNEFDQKRILIANNRQALANWLAEGLMK